MSLRFFLRDLEIAIAQEHLFYKLEGWHPKGRGSWLSRKHHPGSNFHGWTVGRSVLLTSLFPVLLQGHRCSSYRLSSFFFFFFSLSPPEGAFREAGSGFFKSSGSSSLSASTGSSLPSSMSLAASVRISAAAESTGITEEAFTLMKGLSWLQEPTSKFGFLPMT